MRSPGTRQPPRTRGQETAGCRLWTARSAPGSGGQCAPGAAARLVEKPALPRSTPPPRAEGGRGSVTLGDSAPLPLPSGPLPRPLHTSPLRPSFTSYGDLGEQRKYEESARMLVVQVLGGMDAPNPPTTGELRTSLKIPESWAYTRLIQLEKPLG